MSDTAKVFLACALGALVGGLVALQFGPHFWWIGTLTGGFVGYLAYDFPAVLAAIPKAYRAARSWQPDKVYWRHLIRDVFGMLGILQCAAALLLAMVMMVMQDPKMTLPMAGLCFLVWSFGGLPLCFLLGVVDDRLPLTYRKTNPISVCLWILAVLFRTTLLFLHFLLQELQAVPARYRDLCFFVKCFSITFFREIHSDLRLLCGTDAALGAAVGYFVGNALVGAIVGGIFGVVNFEILSIRILKVVPTTRSIFRS